jgi:hypothetical protein
MMMPVPVIVRVRVADMLFNRSVAGGAFARVLPAGDWSALGTIFRKGVVLPAVVSASVAGVVSRRASGK